MRACAPLPFDLLSGKTRTRSGAGADRSKRVRASVAAFIGPTRRRPGIATATISQSPGPTCRGKPFPLPVLVVIELGAPRRWSSCVLGRSSLWKMLEMCFSTAPGVTTRAR